MVVLLKYIPGIKIFAVTTMIYLVCKVLWKIMLVRLLKHIANDVIQEFLYGFRAGRLTTGIILSARQLPENCMEQRMELYQVFVDLTNAFNSQQDFAL